MRVRQILPIKRGHVPLNVLSLIIGTTLKRKILLKLFLFRQTDIVSGENPRDQINRYTEFVTIISSESGRFFF